ncbi:MAG: EFR1 family ferrodoxin, partial [Fibrobacteres bacterium]|nr:EFR1 family ferrodoxin [Fibrobacterota bacterium]
PIRKNTAVLSGSFEYTGIVAPVYAWGSPIIVENFLQRLDFNKCGYLFTISVNAGGVAGTNIAYGKAIKKCGGSLNAGFSLPLVSNYILFGNPPGKEKIESIIGKGRTKLAHIVSKILAKESGIVEKDSAIANLLLGTINKAFRSRMHSTDKKFTSSEKCNGCGICARVCAAENITIVNKRPLWHNKCEQCLACMHWCPETAIDLGKATKGKKRYHHPEITLTEMLHN